MTKWHKGPPPSCGWWPASLYKIPGRLRWWNGVGWSFHVGRSYSAEEAAYWARQAYPFSDEVLWTDRPKNWPKRSRT